MKTNIYHLFFLIIGTVFGIAVYGSYESHTKHYHMSTTDPIEKEIVVEYVYVPGEPQIEYVYVPYEEPFYRNFTEEDVYFLKDMAMREAEGEGVIGQCWVMYTVICRAEYFGKSIREICESSAFETSKDRSGLTPNENCNRAFALIEEGWTPKPLWFRRDGYHGFAEPLCQVGNHCFSTTLEEE